MGRLMTVLGHRSRPPVSPATAASGRGSSARNAARRSGGRAGTVVGTAPAHLGGRPQRFLGVEPV